MKKTTKISTKIKILGALLIFLMLSALSTTIYLNQQNVKDALVVNIVGKQRMLTQKIAKNIFYIHYSSNKDFQELNSATAEFITGLNILREGDIEKGIASAPTQKISAQLKEATLLWDNFYRDIQKFELLINSNDANRDVELNKIVNSIYEKNTILLDNVDNLVTLYTNYSEKKTEYIKTFQYSVATLLLLLLIYSLFQLKSIESHVDEFINYSKMLANDKNGIKIEPINIETQNEREIVEVSDTINCFIDKINSAIDYSNEALLQSQQASEKLEELTDEFDTILNELEDSSLVAKHLENSEDIVIESTEGLFNATKRLQNLKLELEELTKSCRTNKI
ncbi:MAG: type IV pili methyl-accepting chemotaxis transducer N-terminal domain-containing protein [Sulfurimonas sp.]|jgi:hypothetical protein